jgi:hypothetical protein
MISFQGIREKVSEIKMKDFDDMITSGRNSQIKRGKKGAFHYPPAGSW